MLKKYNNNKDNDNIANLTAQKEKIVKQLERFCSRKQTISERIEDYRDTNTSGQYLIQQTT